MAQLDVKLNPSKSTITADLKSNGIVSYIAGPGIIIDGRIIKADFTTISTATNLKNGVGTKSIQQNDGTETFINDYSAVGIEIGEVVQDIPGEIVVDAENNKLTVTNGAFGESSAIFGGKSLAHGKRALAEGTSTLAIGNYSHAEGNATVARAAEAHTEGLSTVAYGIGSHAEGTGTVATGLFSHTEGTGTFTTGNYAHAEGDHTEATSSAAHSEGLSTTASGPYSHAEGSNNTASGSSSHAEGLGNTASGNVSHVEGQYNDANGKYGVHIEGLSNIASKGFQTVIGQYNDYEHDSDAIFVVGNGDADGETVTRHDAFQVLTDGSAKVGRDVTSSDVDLTVATKKYVDDQGTSRLNIENGAGNGSAQMKAEGGATTVNFGSGTEEDPYVNPHAHNLDSSIAGLINYGATGQYATAFGGKNVAQGLRSSAEGTRTLAKGDYSHAEGDHSVTLGPDSHAEGLVCVTGPNAAGSHAEGSSTQALGVASHSEGYDTKATGVNSHAEGSTSQATGVTAHAEGGGTVAAGENSHAEGANTLASHDHSHAEGYNTRTGRDQQHVSGIYNVGRANTLFEVGNGEDDDNRANVFEVYQDGHTEVGRATISGDTNLTLTTKGYVDTSDLALSDRIDNLEHRGRFLSTWNATTGKPSTYPTVPEGAEYPYTYIFKAGDYYIIHNVPATDAKRPAGSFIRKETAESEWEVQSEAETSPVSDNGTYTYDGTNWVLMGAGTAAAWGSIGGNIADQTDLQTALGTKANDSAVVHRANEEYISGKKHFQNTVETGTILPEVNYSKDLGSSDKKWKDLYLQGKLNLTNAANTHTWVAQAYGDWGIALDRDATRVYTFEYGALFNSQNADLGQPGNKRWRDLYLSRNLTDGTNSVSVSNIVTTDTAQTISGEKTFSDKIHLASSKTLEFDHTTYPANIENYNGTMRINPYTNNTYYMYCFGQNGMYPFWDNIRSSGLSNHRWATVYTTNLSDATNSVTVAQIENNTNKVTSISASSTDTQYPSAKCVYDIVGNINTILDQINGEVI